MSSLNLLQSLQENLSQKAGVKSVFGDPIPVGDKVVVPAARLTYGFGAGAGTGGVGEKNKGEGGGGGGGVHAKPVGVFVIGPQETRFVSTHEARRTLGVLAVGVIVGLLLGRRRRREAGGWLLNRLGRRIPLRD
jgi:uncharacterized spore protein YtfJ